VVVLSSGLVAVFCVFVVTVIVDFVVKVER
jgi:hypothetical protein